MKGKTRAFINQWILQSENNSFKCFQRMLLISHHVNRRGEYPEIDMVLQRASERLRRFKDDLVELQTLFNDPRAVKIEV